MNSYNTLFKLKKLGRLLGKPFKSFLHGFLVDSYKKSDGTCGIGYRMISDNGYMIRFNFNKGTEIVVDPSCLNADSVDFWNIHDASRFDKPTYTVEFEHGSNILKVWNYLVTAYLHQNIHKLSESEIPVIRGIKQYYDNPTLNRRKTFAEEHNIDTKNISLKKSLWLEYLESVNLDSEWKAFEDNLKMIKKISKGTKEKNSYSVSYRKFSNNVNRCEDTSETIFKKLNIGLDLLLRSPMQRSLIVVGDPGTGKTHTVTNFLEQSLGSMGDKWEYSVLSRISDSQLYELLYKNRNKIIVLDEASSFLTNGKNKAIQEMLKSTLQFSKLTPEEQKEFYGGMKQRRESNTVLPFKKLVRNCP